MSDWSSDVCSSDLSQAGRWVAKEQREWPSPAQPSPVTHFPASCGQSSAGSAASAAGPAPRGEARRGQAFFGRCVVLPEKLGTHTRGRTHTITHTGPHTKSGGGDGGGTHRQRTHTALTFTCSTPQSPWPQANRSRGRAARHPPPFHSSHLTGRPCVGCQSGCAACTHSISVPWLSIPDFRSGLACLGLCRCCCHSLAHSDSTFTVWVATLVAWMRRRDVGMHEIRYGNIIRCGPASKLCCGGHVRFALHAEAMLNAAMWRAPLAGSGAHRGDHAIA